MTWSESAQWPGVCACVCVCVCERERDESERERQISFLVVTNPLIACVSVCYQLQLHSGPVAAPLIQTVCQT